MTSPEMEHFFSPNLGEDKKKKVFIKNGTLFSRVQVNIKNKNKKRSSLEMKHFFLSTDLRSDAHQSQIIRGDADEDHTQIVGGIQSNDWGWYISPPPLFRHHCYSPSVGLSTKMQNKKTSRF